MAHNDHLYAQALAAANLGIWRWDLTTNQVTWSDNIERLFGLEKGRFDGTYASFLAMLPEDDQQRLVEAVDRSLTLNLPYEIEHRIVWPSGAAHWYLGKGNVVCDHAGNPVEMIGTTQDITERKIAELALQESQALLAMSQALANFGSWSWDIASGRIHWSPQMYLIYGVTPVGAEVNFDTAMAATHPEDRAAITEQVQALLAGGEIAFFEYRLIHPDGEMRHVWATTKVERDRHSHPIRLIGTVQDNTERERNAQALRESEEKFRSVVTAMAEGIVVQDRNDRILACNPAAEQILGLTRDQLMGLSSFDPLWRAVHEDGTPFDSQQHPSVITLRTGQAQRNTIMGVHKPDGTLTWISINSQPLVAPGEARPYGVVVSFHDITERRNAEAEIQKLNTDLEQRVRDRTAQLEAANRELEAFCYSISHDLRAPLRAIDGFAHVLKEDYADKLDAAGEEHLNRVRNGAQRMSELIDDLLDLSQLTRAALVAADVDLSTLARDILAQLAATAPGRVVDMEIAPGITARGDPRLMRIALTNLLDNAWKYTGKTPQARIELGEAQIGHERVFFVRDNGAGFEMQYAGKLFGPFQRLHNVSDFPGTGVGLATVARIMHRHGGRVWAEAAPGQGAIFYFTLPQQ